MIPTRDQDHIQNAGTVSIDRLMDKAKDYLSRGDTETALTIYKDVVSYSASVDCSEQRAHAADAQEKVGDVYSYQELWQLASDSYSHALNLTASSFGLNSVNSSNVLQKLANTSMKLRDYDNALEALKERLDILRYILPSPHLDPSLVSVVLQMGRMHFEKGNLQNAIKVYNSSLLLQRSLSPRNLLTEAATYSFLGSIYMSVESYHNALSAAELAVTIKKQVFGENHYEVAEKYMKLASMQFKLRIFVKSLSSLSKCLSICQSLSDVDTKSLTSAVLILMSKLYHHMGASDVAKKHLQEALAIERSNATQDHKKIVQLLGRAFIMHKSSGELNEAIECAEQAAEITLLQPDVFGQSFAVKLWERVGSFHVQKGNVSRAHIAFEIAANISASKKGC